ncbi:hypothetical protein MNBD_GAMMA10-2986 [hydrothermal vent metagenome]|uniref:Uncharacterized protein n=1 Tax=hydrothermal vent metagenome TaxID=652676 RepID=A0A3B0YWS1_9ZZZZ
MRYKALTDRYLIKKDNAANYLSYLATADAQNIYAKYAFVSVGADELRLKNIP